MQLVSDLPVLGQGLRGRILVPRETALGQLSQDYLFRTRILRALENHNQQEAHLRVEQHVTEAREYHLAVYERQHQTRRDDSTRHQWSHDSMESIPKMETDVAIQTSRSARQSSP